MITEPQRQAVDAVMRGSFTNNDVIRALVRAGVEAGQVDLTALSIIDAAVSEGRVRQTGPGTWQRVRT